MAINVYLNFEGNSKTVIETYAAIFGIPTPQIMFFKDMPQDPNHPLPPEALDRVLHCQLDFADGSIMFSDTFPGMPYTLGNHAHVMLSLMDRDELERIFNAFAAKGKVTMPLQETFWSKCYGQVIDEFGINWQLNLC